MVLRQLSRGVIALAAAAMLVLGGVVYAQLEGGDRGAAPMDSSVSFEVSGIDVDVKGPNADAARLAG